MIQLTWTSNSTNEDGFQLHDDIANTDVTGGGTAAGVTTYTLTVLPNGLYCLTVYAFNAAGASDLSNEACATTPP